MSSKRERKKAYRKAHYGQQQAVSAERRAKKAERRASNIREYQSSKEEGREYTPFKNRGQSTETQPNPNGLMGCVLLLILVIIIIVLII